MHSGERDANNHELYNTTQSYGVDSIFAFLTKAACRVDQLDKETPVNAI